MGINIALAKSIAKSTSIMYESIGIINISFVEPNIFHFTLADSSTKDVTIANLVSFTQVDKTKLDSLDETVLSKFTFAGGKLLYDGLPIESGGIANLLGFTTDDLVESATKKYVTPTEKSTWNAKSNFDGNYNSLTNKPVIPTVDVTKSYVDTGLSGKEATITSGTTSQYYRGDKTFQTLDKTTVGLENVDNTSDINKPISSATQTALNLKADTSSVNTSLGNKVDKVVGSSLVADTEISKIHTHSNKATLDGITSENITSWTGKAEVSAIPTTTSQLTNNSNFAVDSSYVHTDNNYTTAEKTKVGKITTTGDGSKYLNDAGNYITVSGGGGGASIDDASSSPITTYSSTKISTDYATKSELNGKANTSHSHTISDVTNLQTSLDGKVDDSQVLTNVPVGAIFTDTVYTHPATHSPSIIAQDSSNRFTTDTEKTSWNSASTNSHTHTNKTILDNTTASYTTAEQTKLSNILGTNTGDETATTIINKIGSPKLFHGIESRSVGATNPLPTYLTTSTFTLSTATNPIVYYYRGTKITVSVDKTVVLGASGLYYISFVNSTGNIQASTSPTGILYTSDVIIATVMWNGTNYGLVNDERHSYDRDTKWHSWAHKTIGTRYSSGLTLTHNGGTGASATFSITSGDIYDEDIQFVIDAKTNCRTLYETSASTYAFDSVLSTAPFKLGTGNRPVMVRDTDYSLITLNSATNRYINVFVYATTDLLNPIYMITETVSATISGTNGYTSLALARTSPFPNISNKGISEELRPLYRLIIRADGQVQAIDKTQDDYRTVSSLPMGAGTTSTTASAITFASTGNIASATVQGALEELDSEKVDKVTGKSLVLDTEITRLGGLSNYTLPVATTTTIGGVKSGTDITVDASGNVSVNDDSHNHTISTVTGLQTALDNKNIVTAKSKNSFLMNQVINDVAIQGGLTNLGVEYRGVASLFNDKFTQGSALTNVIEISTIVDGNQIDAWYQDTGAYPLRYAYSTDENSVVWTRSAIKDPVIPTCRLPYTFKYNNKYYTMGCLTLNGGICLWESTDKLNWTILNGGNPIITASAGVWSNLWNPCVSVIGDEWHVWIEAGSLANQTDVGLVYTHGTLATLSSFNANKSAGQVIQGGGNPNSFYIPERNVILILHGEIFETGDATGEQNYWTIRASYVYLTNSLSVLASYVRCPKSTFYIYKSGIHVCDPQLVELPNTKTSKILFNYSYDQVQINQTFADVTILDLFDGLISYKKATTTPTVYNPPLQNSWVNYSGSMISAGYYKTIDNIIHLQGAIKSGNTSDGQLLFTLPIGYRPTSQIPFIVLVQKTDLTYFSARIDITTNGGVYSTGLGGQNALLSLNGINFLAV